MGTNKKPKKKYVPRDVRYPSLVTRINSFAPFEAALDRLLDTGEVTVDEDGLMIFKDSAGNTQSFVSSIKTYIDLMTVYLKREKIEYNLYPLHILHNRMFEAVMFDEEEVIEARKCLNVCKDIIGKIKPSVLMEVLNTVRLGNELQKKVEPSLKNPDIALFALKHKAGDLTYEDVADRYKKYQDLVIEEPDNEHYVELRDFYVEFYAAYNFYRQQQLSKV